MSNGVQSPQTVQRLSTGSHNFPSVTMLKGMSQEWLAREQQLLTFLTVQH